MIQLRSDCLVFKTADGSVPCSAEQVAIELVGDGLGLVDPEIVRQAALGVLHYFREELGRDQVTVGEFSAALARVLRGFGLQVEAEEASVDVRRVVESDLCRLAADSGPGFELVFFARLRAELTARLRESPAALCFTGLRPCVKRLVGTRRWSPRCDSLRDHIIDYLSRCLGAATEAGACALVVR